MIFYFLNKWEFDKLIVNENGEIRLDLEYDFFLNDLMINAFR
jgi:hypothetical protein